MLKKILFVLVVTVALGFIALSFIKIPAPTTQITKDISVGQSA